jgi:uridine kinase
MCELERILRSHASAYPAMRPPDAVKLIHQNEFGPGHLIFDEGQSLALLRQELAMIKRDLATPLSEPIGNGLVRLHLAAAGRKVRPDTLGRWFVLTAADAGGSAAAMEHKLGCLRDVCQTGAFGFSPEELSQYLSKYTALRYPAVRHSEAYRRAYRPAYRLVRSVFADYFALFSAIDGLLAQKQRVVVGIDGMCGAGKTTLAGLLARVYGCNVIAMDHFFLPPGLRTAQRLAEPGGNIHYERFAAEAASGLLGGEAFSYRIFDCRRMDYSGVVDVVPGRVTVVEGSYSLHPAAASLYDLKVFLGLPAAEQRQRLVGREGEKGYRRFAEEWIPMENRYFQAHRIREGCDLVFDGRMAGF